MTKHFATILTLLLCISAPASQLQMPKARSLLPYAEAAQGYLIRNLVPIVATVACSVSVYFWLRHRQVHGAPVGAALAAAPVFNKDDLRAKRVNHFRAQPPEAPMGSSQPSPVRLVKKTKTAVAPPVSSRNAEDVERERLQHANSMRQTLKELVDKLLAKKAGQDAAEWRQLFDHLRIDHGIEAAVETETIWLAFDERGQRFFEELWESELVAILNCLQILARSDLPLAQQRLLTIVEALEIPDGVKDIDYKSRAKKLELLLKMDNILVIREQVLAAMAKLLSRLDQELAE